MKTKLLFLAIILIGLGLRLWKINMPLLEFNPSRQIQTAEITANLIKSDFDFLHPYVNYYGSGNTKYLLAEFPIFNIATAAFQKATGFENEISGRLVSVISFLISSLILFLLTRNIFDEKIALYTIAFFTISPLNVLTSRSFQPDEFMLACTLSSLFLFIKWAESKKVLFLIAGAGLLGIADLIKISSFGILVFPIVYILLINRSKNFLRYFSFIFLAALVPTILWLRHAAFFSEEFQLATASNFRVSQIFRPELFSNFKYYSNIFGYELNLAILPIGIFLFLVGIFKKLYREQKILYFWFLGLISYFLIFNIHIMTHEYYHLPFIPFAAIIMALGIDTIISAQRDKRLRKYLLLSLLTIIYLASLPTIRAKAYNPIERFNDVVFVGKRIENLTKPNDLVVGMMDDGPALVHYSRRMGWGFAINPQKTLEHQIFIGLKDNKISDPKVKLEELKKSGAVIFASSFKPQFLSNTQFSNYMYSNYKIIEETDNYVIFDLKHEFSR